RLQGVGRGQPGEPAPQYDVLSLAHRLLRPLLPICPREGAFSHTPRPSAGGTRGSSAPSARRRAPPGAACRGGRTGGGTGRGGPGRPGGGATRGGWAAAAG